MKRGKNRALEDTLSMSEAGRPFRTGSVRCVVCFFVFFSPVKLLSRRLLFSFWQCIPRFPFDWCCCFFRFFVLNFLFCFFPSVDALNLCGTKCWRDTKRKKKTSQKRRRWRKNADCSTTSEQAKTSNKEKSKKKRQKQQLFLVLVYMDMQWVFFKKKGFLLRFNSWLCEKKARKRSDQ